MKRFLVALLSTCSVLFVTSAQAEGYGEWKHLTLTSRQGAQIRMDYRKHEYAYYGNVVMTLSDFWIHLYKENLRPEAQVRAVLINHPYYMAPRTQVQFFDFKYEDGHFVAHGLVTNNVFNAHQELAVVIDGEWQKVDFNSDNSNFAFRFFPYISK